LVRRLPGFISSRCGDDCRRHDSFILDARISPRKLAANRSMAFLPRNVNENFKIDKSRIKGYIWRS
ncbi:MAG: hypothetical protein WCB44_27485, partial [Stellaceae bacterium]